MSAVLVVAEHDGRALGLGTAKTVACAASLSPNRLDVVVLAPSDSAIASQAALLEHVDRVLHVDCPADDTTVAAALAPRIAAIPAQYSHVFGPSTTFGKDVMPRVAALLGVGQLSDIMAVESSHRFKRPIYAGNAIVTVEASPTKCVVATARAASYSAVGERPEPAPVESRVLEIELPSHTRFVALEAGAADRPDLQTASRVVSGGRGMGSAENFELLERLADALGAAVGASRAAVDSGYVANDLQVGQTGKIIAPDLYVAVGISGAIQHLTGIKDAGTIVAINSDPEAPIFEIADLGVVGDLFEILPELIEALKDVSS
jgi:electron transfer flavoprotein alpha subunit